MDRGAAGADAEVRFAELIAAISLATDLGMAMPLETGLAVCRVATLLGRRLGLELGTLQRTYQLALLQHIGCTAAASQVAAVMGDELVMREHAATLDFADRKAMFGFLLGHVGRTSSGLGRPAALAKAVVGAKAMTGTIVDVCESAAMLGERFGYPADCLRDLGCVYEYWDGSGFPGVAAGDEITEPAQMVQVASLAVAAHQTGGTGWATDLVRRRKGHSLSPAVADALLADLDPLLAPPAPPAGLWEDVIALEPVPRGAASGDEIDRVLLAVADFVDLKSPFLAGHSSGVADLAAAAGDTLGLAPADVVLVRRAAWIHDLGRLGVSSRVWDHAGALSPDDWERVRLHPYYTGRVLDRTPCLAPLASVASTHHERLDGSGYFRGAAAPQLSAPARVLAAADEYHAMTEPRPHRPALSPEAAAAELRADADAGRIDHEAAEAVISAAGQPVARRRPTRTAGLTPRETETLRLVARGLSIKQIARELVVAPKTVDGHIQRIYAKIGVSSRAGATLFALSNGILPAEPQNREISP